MTPGFSEAKERPRLLGDGQRVHIGTQSNPARRRPIGAVSAGRSSGDGCDDTVVAELSIRDAQVIELLAQQLLRVDLMTGHLGEAMEQAARSDRCQAARRRPDRGQDWR